MLAKTMKVNTITDSLELSLLRSVNFSRHATFLCSVCISPSVNPQSVFHQYAVCSPQPAFCVLQGFFGSLKLFLITPTSFPGPFPCPVPNRKREFEWGTLGSFQNGGSFERVCRMKFLNLDNMRFRAKIIDINCIQHFTRK